MDSFPIDHDEILRANRQVYDDLAAASDPLCRPAKDEELANPLATVDAAGWLGKSIAGKHLLCLAAGGGRQSALYAAAGAIVTVVDLSGAMLELDRRVAAERGFQARIFQASMDHLPMLRDAEFDLVIHPVSTCYLPDIVPVYREVARVLRPGGIYVSQHKQPTSLQVSTDPLPQGGFHIRHHYYRDRRPVPPPETAGRVGRRLRESGAVEFLHRWEELIGGLCRTGFVIEDLVEPNHTRPTATSGTFADRAQYVAPYVRIKARRRDHKLATTTANPTSQLWLPNDSGPERSP